VHRVEPSAEDDERVRRRPADSSSQTTRLLICDDAPEACAALRAILSGQRGIEIVGEAGDGQEAVEQALALRPDVVLMDAAMPVLDGAGATRRIRELVPSARVIAFAGSDDPDLVMQMIEAGASGYCVKGAPLWELERAIADVGNPLVRVAHGLARSANARGTGELVARELAELTGAAAAATGVR
jgi:DNA-binding NarL/FixJ family response regulator